LRIGSHPTAQEALIALYEHAMPLGFRMLDRD
jgi:hypothetical protein